MIFFFGSMILHTAAAATVFFPASVPFRGADGDADGDADVILDWICL